MVYTASIFYYDFIGRSGLTFLDVVWYSDTIRVGEKLLSFFRTIEYCEGVVRGLRDLSTDSAYAWQILKNETHVCFSNK